MANRKRDAHPTVDSGVTLQYCGTCILNMRSIEYFNLLRFHFMTPDQVECILFEIWGSYFGQY
jgi:hypothetical protein